MKSLDVVAICNALVDILVHAEEEDIKTLGLNKGVMHLVSHEQQTKALEYFTSKEKTIELGGSALNAMRTMASLGQKVAFAGMIADDHFGLNVQNRMKQLGITSKLGHSTEPTGTCLILVTPDGERTMLTYLGASRLYTEKIVPYQEIQQAKILHFCGYQWDTDGQKSAIAHAVQHAHQHDTIVSFDMADPFVVQRYAETFKSVIKNDADLVFANREEASILFGSPEQAAEAIAACDAIAVIKLGAEGALVRQKEQVWHIPSYPTNVIDTTAAGDMFAAGFLYGFSKGSDFEKCGQIAAFLASDVISRMGASISENALQKAKTI